jgi:DNA polymerase III epsilon subunit-like protein
MKLKDLIPGGVSDGKSAHDIANKHNVPLEQIQKQIQMGIKVEMEHTNDRAKAEEIARDHLMELPDYYDKLKAIEPHHDLNEADNLVSVTAGDMLDSFIQKYAGRTIICFDTETLGLKTQIDYIQLTELAAMAVDGNTFEIIDTMNYKAELRPDAKNVTSSPYSPEFKDYVKREKGSLKRDTKRRSKKKKSVNWKDMKINKDRFFTPKMAMDLTRYDEPTAEFIQEKQIIEKFIQFISKYDNVVLMAQNARFDMKVIASRARKYNLRLPSNIKVADTLVLTKNTLTALLKTLDNSNDTQAKELKQKLTKTDKRGVGRISMSLGVLAKALDIEPTGWHNALADVEMTIQVLRKVIDFIKQRRDVDIRNSMKKSIY